MLNKLIFVLAAACALVGSVTHASAQNVTPIHGAGTASAINGYQFAGEGTIRIGQVVVSETSLATLLAPLTTGPGSSLAGVSTHTLDCGSLGTIITTDVLTLTPVNETGLFQLSIKAEIVGGTGQFAGATGQLHFNGFANLATGQVSWRVEGFYR